MKRRELESLQVRSIHYSSLFLPPIKKYQNHAILLTRLTGGVYHDDAPAFAAVRTSLNRFFIFPSINLGVNFTTRKASPGAVEGPWICPKTTPLNMPGHLGRIFTPVSPSPVSTVGPAIRYKFMALIWLNTFCNPL
jgi:hypothetical protein